MAKIQVESILATSEPIKKYGIALDPQALRDLAEDLKRGNSRSRIEHDPRIKLDRRILDAYVRKIDENGNVALFIKFEIDEDEWAKVGDRRGESISFFADFQQYGRNKSSHQIFLGIDAAYYDNDTVEKVMNALSVSTSGRIARLYQCSDVTEAAVIILKASFDVLIGLGANYIYDCLKPLLSPLRQSKDTNDKHAVPTQIEFQNIVEVEPGRITIRNTALVKTTNPDDLRAALEKMGEISESALELAEFNAESQTWEEVS